MGGGGSAPQFDAQGTSNQQQIANANTAVAQTRLNQTNQVTPYGSLKYTEDGGSYDGLGNWIPKFTATTTLSPEQQKLYEQTTGLQSGALDTAANLLPKVNQAINTPLTDNKQLRDDAYKALTARSTEDIGRQMDAQKVQLANQGINAGSKAYDDALVPYTRAITDASNQATINAGNIAAQNLSTEQAIRNQPLTDYQALLGFGGGVTSPNFVNTPQTNIQPTDVSGPAMAAYQGELNAYNQRQQAGNSALGGLFGLGGSILGGATRGMFGLGGLFGK